MIVVFEGVDGSGKTTQVNLLKEHLQASGRECTVLKCPDRQSPSGSLIASYLRGDSKIASPQIANLILAANIWEVAEKATNLSKEGHIVIMDRFKHTHLAYSMARGSAKRDCESVLEGLPNPDKIVFLDIEPESALSRKAPGEREILENPVFQGKVYANYKSIMTTDWLVIEADREQNVVHTSIVSMLNL